MLPWIIGGLGVLAGTAIVKALSESEDDTNSSSYTEERIVSEISTPSAEEIEKERVAKIKKEIKEYKSKITQILKAEYQVEVEIKKDSIKVVDDVFVNEKLEEIEKLQKEIAQLNTLKQKLGEYNV